MTGHDIELLGNLTPLDRDGLTLFAQDRRARNDGIKFLFQPVHGLHRAIHIDRHGNHRSRDQNKRERDDRRDDDQPEEGIVRIHR